MTDTLNPLQAAQLQIKKACEKLKLEPAVYEILKDPQRFIEISIPIKMDDGSLKVFKGYRSAHNHALGPSKGGVRFHQNVNAEEVKALSTWMSLKAGLLAIPYGGGKGGITVDPKKLSERELESLSRGYIRGLYKYLGERIDIPAPDVNTNGNIMSYFTDEYIKLNGDKEDLGTFTGKPLILGGSLGRSEATGFGVVITTKYVAKKMGLDLKNAQIGLQGFGNVGSYTLKYLIEEGAKVKYLSIRDESEECGRSALYSEDGFDYESLQKYREENKTLAGYPDAEKISDETFWSTKFDILIPAALENIITEEIAKNLDVKLIAEGANGPTTPEADKILKEKNVEVIADILANSGGVLVSYYEWIQNQYGNYWSKDEVQEKQVKDMKKALDGIYQIKEEYKTDLREASYMFAIKRIAQAMKLRGWY
ncbi:Glu/Leu/Phe/Val family dehydrogenase [Anaerococcus hydrogenalis]|uniref:Glutamate dehydrogenase n=1 Tax=Anaerococcus hydrogenalis TaxID=33029 RepID=A0A2N6UGX6_9FIRM|nr:Glu/Leu/Phe/Val dehydrogenase [Anaerococcus hydrogenalis]MDK7695676.1 Glu/Leu/Phe/Val dehydrogenase [Anaerococcus hydrogenalis]MDK7697501.1 Glu/Leu/Phe/Val dehydrogenase [Anaerococcus hydrogenalis]MDK7708768.1 Glu/Leu/Phe/Val dehydrogenase [Anaerococcus hydrogenalis]PMC80797.1 glutamate dehydrogenase [Anaerococcus hydrogenalis]